MDLKIDYLGFTEEKLDKINFCPSTVWINFYGKVMFFTEDAVLLHNIAQKFKESRILFLNIKEELKEQLQFIVKNNDNIQVLAR